MKNKMLCMMVGAALFGSVFASNVEANETVQVAAQTAQDSVEQEMIVPKKYVEADVFEIAKLRSDKLTDVYKLAKYDEISIVIVGSDTYGSIKIGPDGYAQIPYVGSVKLAGLTVDEATKLLTDRMGEYIKIPNMSLHIQNYGPRSVYVMGEVANPGVQKLPVDVMNTYAAIVYAGGMKRKARPTKVQVLRVVGDTMYYKTVNMKNYVTKHDLTQNLVLEDGDIVYVPKTNGIKIDIDVLPYVNIWAMYRSLTKD